MPPRNLSLGIELLWLTLHGVNKLDARRDKLAARMDGLDGLDGKMDESPGR